MPQFKGKEEKHKVVTSFSITTGDRDMLDELTKTMETNRSDIVRTAIRLLYFNMKK